MSKKKNVQNQKPKGTAEEKMRASALGIPLKEYVKNKSYYEK